MRALAFLLFGSLLAAAADRELTGRVVDANTGEPVVRAHITLRFFQGGNPAPEVTLLSDMDGSFRLINLPEGGYQIECQKAGYLPVNQGMAPAPPGDRKAAATVELKLTAQAAIEGTVVDEKDSPVENAFLQLLRQQVMNGRRQFLAAQGASTDETGYFRIFGLPAGRYYLSIRPQRRSGAARMQATAYPELYYPNAAELAAAQAIDLKAGDEPQLHIRLPEPVPAWEIRGVVAAAGANVGLMLVRQPDSQMFQQNVGETNWDAKTRSFRITHVTPGIYRLTATAQDGKSRQEASTVVTVGNADVAGIRLEPVETAIDGTVRTEGNTGQQRIMTYVTLQAERSSNSVQVEADGKFHFSNLSAGTYRVVPQINNQQWCFGSILENGRDVRDGVTISAGIAPDPLEIVLTSHCGTIDLTLAPSDGPWPPNVTAVLLRKAGDEYVLENQVYLGGGTANPVARPIQGVAPGDYVLYAWPQDAQIEYANAESMRQFESYGKAVTVTADGKASVTVDKVLTIPAKN